MNERRFQKKLASLVKRYDEAMSGTKKAKDAHEDEWNEMMIALTPDQVRRAEQLLELHVGMPERKKWGIEA